jgi:hypothetical protein
MRRRPFHIPPEAAFSSTGSIALFDISGKLDSVAQTKNGLAC